MPRLKSTSISKQWNYSFNELRIRIWEERKETVVVKEELTALHLVTHITTVVPAITLQLSCNANARCAGKLAGASCSENGEMMEGEKDNDKMSKAK